MLVFSEQKLAFIAVPKTGTTALELCLRAKADVIFARHRKHITAQRFHRRVAPFLKDALGLDPERFAVIREPEEQIRSWYRYRCREGHEGSKSIDGLTFDQFVQDVISDRPPPHAGIGSQFRLLTSASGHLLVHHLFAYEAMPVLLAFLSERFGEEISPRQRNVSPAVEAPLSPQVRARLRQARAPEFALYDRVIAAGGHLRTAI